MMECEKDAGGGGSIPPTPDRPDDVNMQSLVNTLARVVVWLDEIQYTDDRQQDTVLTHDVLPDQASDMSTRQAN